MKKLAGRNALITGGSSGIGLAIAKTLAAKGMNVAIAARSQQKLLDAQEALDLQGNQAIFVPTDVTDTRQLRNLVRETTDRLGSIDVLVNNAGIETYRDFHELSIEEIEETIIVNLTAALQLTRLVLPGMLRSMSGHVVNMSSTAGKHGPAFGAAYGASKAGLISLTQSLRAEYKNCGISASVICPGFTHEGGMYERMKTETGRCTPWYMGSTNRARVAQATVRAIVNDRPEMIVNSPPLRPVFTLCQALPSVGSTIIRAASFRFLRCVAKSRSEPTRKVA